MVQAQPGQKINITLLDFTVGVPGEPAHTMCLVSTAIVDTLRFRKFLDVSSERVHVGMFVSVCMYVCLSVCHTLH